MKYIIEYILTKDYMYVYYNIWIDSRIFII
jgi:hypothetical protein